MRTDYLRCEHCETILGGAVVNTPSLVPCPACQTLLLTRVFPAYFRASTAEEQRQETLGSDEDASCFFHPSKKAVVPCGNCGRFLCGLCDLAIDGHHLCPTCVEASRGKDGGTAKLFVREHIRHDYRALTLAVLGTVIPYISLLTAPISIYYATRYWKTPLEAMVPRGHVRQIIALLLCVIQLTVWTVLAGYYWVHHS